MGAEQKATHIPHCSPQLLCLACSDRSLDAVELGDAGLSRASLAPLSLSASSLGPLCCCCCCRSACAAAPGHDQATAKPSGPLGSFEERYQVACFSPVGVVGAVTRRPALRVDDCYGWPIAHWRVSRSNGTQRWKALGSMLPCFGGRRVLWVLFSSSPSTLS